MSGYSMSHAYTTLLFPYVTKFEKYPLFPLTVRITPSFRRGFNNLAIWFLLLFRGGRISYYDKNVFICRDRYLLPDFHCLTLWESVSQYGPDQEDCVAYTMNHSTVEDQGMPHLPPPPPPLLPSTSHSFPPHPSLLQMTLQLKASARVTTCISYEIAATQVSLHT